MKIHQLITFLAAINFLCGCMSARIKPGHTQTTLPGVSVAAVQSEDPQAVTTQTVEQDTTTHALASTNGAPVILETVTHHKVTTTIGAAQKNTMQEIAAKLASVRWLQYLGVSVALFGVASIAYPPLRLLIGSVTTSAWCIASGAAMVFLPLVVVGHEVLIMGVCGGIAAIWFLAHRHGSISGQLATLKNTNEKTP